MKPKQKSKKACKEQEKVLSKIGLHGGNVHIKKDEKKFGVAGDKMQTLFWWCKGKEIPFYAT